MDILHKELQRPVPLQLHAAITSVRALGNGDSIWLTSFTTDGELLADDEGLLLMTKHCVL